MRKGFTLVEAMTVMAILAALASFAAPRVMRTMEQAHADMAAASLGSVANAQRFYWLEHRTYATTLAALQADNLISSDLATSSNRYQIAITSASSAAFTATANRTGNGVWSGSLNVNQTGVVGGQVTISGQEAITPGFH